MMSSVAWNSSWLMVAWMIALDLLPIDMDCLISVAMPIQPTRLNVTQVDSKSNLWPG